MDVSENSGTPKSSILIGFSIINHPFWGTTIFGNTHVKNHDFSRLFDACFPMFSRSAEATSYYLNPNIVASWTGGLSIRKCF